MSSRPLVALFGGSFDPVHLGHQAIVEALDRQLSPQKIQVIPCHIPPHKPGLHTSPSHRVAMLKRAFEGAHEVEVSERELQKASVSYTFDTVSEVREEWGSDVSLCFAIGMDSWQNFRTWHRWREILNKVHLILFARPGVDSLERIHDRDRELAEYFANHSADISVLSREVSGSIVLLAMEEVDVTSTDVRAWVRGGEEVKAGDKAENAEGDCLCLSGAVASYIAEHKLYQD